jgi:hypothetical protein
VHTVQAHLTPIQIGENWGLAPAEVCTLMEMHGAKPQQCECGDFQYPAFDTADIDRVWREMQTHQREFGGVL